MSTAYTVVPSWLFSASWSTNRYSGAGQFGFTTLNYTSVQLGPSWNFSDHLQGSLVLGTDHTQPKNKTPQKDYSASLQLRRTLDEHYTWRGAVGATRVITGPGTQTTTSVFELGVNRQGERASLDLDAKRSVVPIGFGLLAREEQANLSVKLRPLEHGTLSLTLTAQRTDPVSTFFFLFPGFGFHIQLYSGATWESATAEYRYDLSPRWVCTAALVRSRAQAGRTHPWGDGDQARIGVVWQGGRL